MLLYMNDGFVGVDGLLEIDRRVAHHSKGSIFIEVFIKSDGSFFIERAVNMGYGKSPRIGMKFIFAELPGCSF